MTETLHFRLLAYLAKLSQGGTMTDGGWVNFESGYPYETIRELMHRGHHVHFDLGGFGGYQAIMRDDRQGVYYGASESRKDGCAIGY